MQCRNSTDMPLFAFNIEGEQADTDLISTFSLND